MFSDPKFEAPAGGLAAILSIMADVNGKDSGIGADRLSQGQYLVGHWNFHNLVVSKLEEYPKFRNIEPIDCPTCEPWKEGGLWFHHDNCKFPEISAYGVCDSVEQFNRLYGPSLSNESRKFCVAFVEVRKSDQPSDGGWRWHKWGPYVGEGKPTHEYLYDEPNFESVFTYSIYELLD